MSIRLMDYVFRSSYFLFLWHLGIWYVREDTEVLMLMSQEGGDSQILAWGRGIAQVEEGETILW